MLAAGKHTVKATGGKFGKAGTGSSGVAVHFVTASGEGISWVGWLTPAAVERTMDTLAMLGFRDDLDVKDGVFGKEHLADKEVEIVVEHEEYEKDGQKKKSAKVKWVNELGGARFGGLESTGTTPVDLKAQLAAARARVGVKKQEPAHPSPMMAPMKAEADLPF